MKKLFSVLLIGILSLTLIGCGNKSASNEESKFEFTEAMIEQRNHNIGLLGSHTVGEYLDYCVLDQKWSEDDSYITSDGNGAIILTGKDKKTGNKIEVRWYKKLTCGGCLSNVYKFKNGDEEGGYQQYLSYLADYKEDLSNED